MKYHQFSICWDYDTKTLQLAGQPAVKLGTDGDSLLWSDVLCLGPVHILKCSSGLPAAQQWA